MKCALVPGSGVVTSLTVRAEQAMLGAVLADPAGQQQLLDLVEPADLQRPWHAQVLAAMRRVQKGGRLPGPAEVYAELRRDPDLPASVSADAVPLATLMEAAPRTGHGAVYAAMVVEGGIRRRLDLAGSRLAQAAESGDLDAALHQAAQAQLELKACRARWQTLPEHLQRELPSIPPNEPAADTAVRHVLTARAGIDHRRRGLPTGSGPPVEERGGPVSRHLADPSADGIGFRQQQTRERRQKLARPQGPTAEAAGERVLRDLAAGPSQIARVRGWLRPENFARPGDGQVYALMCDMDAAGMAVDPVTVSWQAARRGLHPEPGRLAGGTGASAVASAREVHRCGLLAEAAQAGRDIQAGAADQGHSLDGLFQSISERLPDLEAARRARQAFWESAAPALAGRPAVRAQSRKPGREAAP